MIQSLRQTNRILTKRERVRLIGLLVVNFVVSGAYMLAVLLMMNFVAVATDRESEPARRANELVGRYLPDLGPAGVLAAVAVAVLVALGTAGCLKVLSILFMQRFVGAVEMRIAPAMLQKRLHQTYLEFSRSNSAQAVADINQHLNSFIGLYVYRMLEVVKDLILVCGMASLVILKSPAMGSMMLLLLTVGYGTFYIFIRRRMRRAGKQIVRANYVRNRTVFEVLRSFKEVSIFGCKQMFFQRFSKAVRNARNANLRAAVLGAIPPSMMEILGFALVLVASIWEISRNGDAVGALPLIALYAAAGRQVGNAAGAVFANVAKMKKAEPMVQVIFDETRDLAAQKQKAEEDRAVGARRLEWAESIELKNVRFRYDEGAPLVLDRVNLRIRKGESVAFVGETGAGKSTLVDILLGLIRPDEGQLMIDGKPIESTAELREWQNCIGYVPQQIQLTDDSIAANIAFGIKAGEIDMDRVVAAAKIAQIHDFVLESSQEGYDLEIGEGGIRLSGGQRQRLGIARAMYHSPDVIVFDEATSALDGATEASLSQAIEELSRNRTLIQIAHRLSTVRQCDVIYLLEQGRVVEFGTFDDLLEKSSGFRKLAQVAGATS